MNEFDIMVESMPRYSTFQACWFRRIGFNLFEVLHPDTSVIAKIKEDLEDIVIFEKSCESLSDQDIKAEFEKYRNRPEYAVGNLTTITNETKKMKDVYDTLLLGTNMLSAYASGMDPDEGIKRTRGCIEWLESTDFYDAPASTQYHESFPGGLVYHTLWVYNHMLKLHELPVFSSISLQSATRVALVHDWCKIGLYEMYTRNVKNNETGKWEAVPSYKYNQKGVPLGHGVSSMYVASKFFKLTTEEAVAIRWHMGAWNVAPNEMNDLQKANETFPLVHLIQFADSLSITEYRDNIGTNYHAMQ